MLEDYLSNRKIIVLNNILNGIDRFLYQNFTNGKSIRNFIFMNNLANMKKTQACFIQKLEEKAPFTCVRFGLYEYKLCYQFLEKKVGIRKNYSDFIKQHISVDSGLDSDDATMDFYAEKIINGLENVDAIGCWRNYPEMLVFSMYIKNAYMFNIDDLYPFPFLHKNELLPYWQNSLSHKKVLVVTSFSETIKNQYKKRNKLWKNKDILPDFFLLTYQVPITNGICSQRNWRKNYEKMKLEILALDFDIALISAGSYGLPLSIDLKKAGKFAIQWGGCYQLWFGILGKRWESNAEINKYINEPWTYPSEKEMPLGACLVDGGSYWK